MTKVQNCSRCSVRLAGLAFLTMIMAWASPQLHAEDVLEVVVTGNDMMQFDNKTLEVPVGKKIKLTFKHVGKMPKNVMGHNLVILNKGVDLVAFATAAMGAAATEYIPPAKKDEVLAFTKLLGGGEEDTIEFTVEEAGEYQYLCSFPGHYGMMKGTLTAK